MQGYQISKVLSNFPEIYKNYIGLRNINKLPTQKKFITGTFLITNINKHWITIYRHDSGYEIFDSFGRRNIEEIKKKLPIYIKKNFELQGQQVQGLVAILFCKSRSRIRIYFF